MNGENVLRVLVIALFIPAMGAVVAYLMGNPATAMALNGVLPLLVFIASALVIVTNLPTTVTVGGALYFAIPLAVLLASLAGFRDPGSRDYRPHHIPTSTGGT